MVFVAGILVLTHCYHRHENDLWRASERRFPRELNVIVHSTRHHHLFICGRQTIEKPSRKAHGAKTNNKLKPRKDHHPRLMVRYFPHYFG